MNSEKPNKRKKPRSFQAPDGTVYEISNLAAFCQEYQLPYYGMSRLTQGKLYSFRGWTRYPPEQTYQGPALQAPDGTVYTPQDIQDLPLFCKKHHLNSQGIRSLVRGESHFSQGWTRYPPEQTYQGPTLQAPDGTIYTAQDIQKLRLFCQRHQLTYSGLLLLVQGKQHSSQGWTRYSPEQTYQGPGLQAPDGTVYTATDIQSLVLFCRRHQLTYEGIRLLVREKLVSSQGWTRYPDPPNPQKPALQAPDGTYQGPALQAPDGTIYTAQVIRRLPLFCQKHQLKNQGIRLLVQGKLDSSQGWTRYPNPPKQEGCPLCQKQHYCPEGQRLIEEIRQLYHKDEAAWRIACQSYLAHVRKKR